MGACKCVAMSSPPTTPTSPPATPLVTRIKPVTSPRTSMKLLALQHYANVYAATAAQQNKTDNICMSSTSTPSPSSPSPSPIQPFKNDNENEPQSKLPPPVNNSTSFSTTTATTTTTTVKTNIPNTSEQVEAALELPFNPSSGSQVTRFEETGDSGQFTIFP